MKYTLIIFKILAILIVMTSFTQVYASCRSQSVKHKFDVLNGYPHGRPALPGEESWIVDHWCALECGGIDDPVNMVYQPYSVSKKKDRWERTPAGCATTCTSENSKPKRTVFNCKPRKIKP
jgi:hypothetical protein